MALRQLEKAQELHRALGEPAAAGDTAALAALCELRLGRPEQALSVVNRLLEGLQDDLAERPGFETIDMRWSCQQVLDALGAARAAPLLCKRLAIPS